MKRSLLVVATVVFMSTKAWAGDIHTADYTAPPPTPASSTQTSVTDPEEIPTADTNVLDIQQILISALLGLLP